MIDSATIKVKSGNGGNGLVSFRREKYVDKGGPWGGDGGKGGDIIIKIDPHVNSLTEFRRKKEFKADNGMNGMKNRRTGESGSDLIIHVPRGTVIYNDKKEVIKDMYSMDDQIILETGGKGGLGNWHFKSSVNQTPVQYTEGEKTELKSINLELKILADIGIIGLPSAGKSSLLNALTRAKAKTADYPFTTLEPNLGILHVENFLKTRQDIILADIPGLIEGASTGKGLGHDFLKHIERTRLVIHVLDAGCLLTSDIHELINNYKVIRSELSNWSEDLIGKVEIVVLNKTDLVNHMDWATEIIPMLEKSIGKKVIGISSITGDNLQNLVKVIYAEYMKNKEMITFEPTITGIKKFTIDNLPNKRIVFKQTIKEADFRRPRS